MVDSSNDDLISDLVSQGSRRLIGDSATRLIKPEKEKPVQVAELPTSIRERIVPAAPTGRARTAEDAAKEAAEATKLEQERDALRKQVAKEKSAASKAQYAKVLAQYEPQLNAPAPKFEAPKETFTQLAGLGAMMMMLGAMAGGKTYGSAIGAMNGLAGMFKGYQEGRKEAFDKAKTSFDENLKAWKENKAQVKEAFQRALKLGSTDLTKATNEVVAELTARGETTAAELVKKRGVAAAAQAFNVASDNADKHFDAVQATVARTSMPAAAGERVALAGPLPTADTATKPKTPQQRLQEIETRLLELQRSKAGEEAAAKFRKENAPRGGEDPQWVRAEGELFRATKEEREEMRRSNIPFEYATGPTVPREERKEWVLRNNRLTKMSDKEIINAEAAGETIQPRPTARTSAVTERTGRVLRPLGALASALETIKELPEGTTTGILPNLKTKDGVVNYIRNNIGNTVTPQEADNLNTILSGIGRYLASIEAGGAATGLVGLQDKLEQAVYIRAGVDTPGKVAFKLADIRRIAEESTEYLIDAGELTEKQEMAAKKAMDRIKKIIPFTTTDVVRADRSSETRTIGDAIDEYRAFAERGTGGSRELSPQDQSALDWANRNPNDPRSRQIKQRLGVQ